MTSLKPITDPYLLVLNIPCFKDAAGHHYVEPLWHKDLIEHTRYIKNLILAAPCSLSDHPKNYLSIEGDPQTAPIQVIELPYSNSTVKSILQIPSTCIRLWKAIGKSKIVHTAIAGWPIPLGWFTAPLTKMRGKYLVIIVESAFWRIPPHLKEKASWKAKLRESVSETLGRWCMQMTDLPIFTTQAYKDSLLPQNKRQDLVIKASWVDKDASISENEAEIIWKKKLNGGPLRILFASRLIPEKGVRVLLEAMKLLSQKDLPIELDIAGQGEMVDECCKFQETLKGKTKVNFIGSVEYGKPVFELIQKYHAVVVPSITDEQPRIVYDAFSQGVPVIASSTDGLKECVINQKTGYFVDPNNSQALAKILEFSEQNREALHKMGMNSIQFINQNNHQEMHSLRHKLILESWEDRVS